MEKNIEVELIDYTEGDKKNILKSAFLRLNGENSMEYVRTIEGSMLWIGKSEFRPNHKRKNWFIEVEVFDKEGNIDFSIDDIKIEKMRCSGNGGQNVNKLETGVMITHIPTGIMMKIQEERSQYKNKKLDISRWEKHRNVKRGDSIGVFKGKEFKEVL